MKIWDKSGGERAVSINVFPLSESLLEEAFSFFSFLMIIKRLDPNRFMLKIFHTQVVFRACFIVARCGSCTSP